MAYTDKEMRIFSQIAYMDMETAYDAYCNDHPEAGGKVPLSEMVKGMTYNTEDGPVSAEDYLRSIGITDEQLSQWSVAGVHDTNSENGLYGCIVETAPGEAVVSFRGSEDMGSISNVENDWVNADLGLVNSTCTNQQEEVHAFLEKYNEMLDGYDNVALTGHSLGGNLAEYATIVSSEYGLDDNISECVSLDGPGFSEEFIQKHEAQIERMSSKMRHPRWSFVGTMLNDLPGVDYDFVQVSNEANAVDTGKYNALTRHDTKYVVFDENGSTVSGEQDTLSKITSVLSEGADHLPTPVGNALITLIGSAWITAMEMKDKLIDEDGLTPMGWGTLVGFVGALTLIGGGNPLWGGVKVVAAIVTVVAVILVYEVARDVIIAVVDAICEAAEKIYNWAKEQVLALKEAILDALDEVKDWWNSNFNAGYRYAEKHPTIVVDTAKLRGSAQRLQSVNSRIKKLDKRLDALYNKVGLLDLWDLIQADLLTGYSLRLTKAAAYLNDTAAEFEKLETTLEQQCG